MICVKSSIAITSCFVILLFAADSKLSSAVALPDHQQIELRSKGSREDYSFPFHESWLQQESGDHPFLKYDEYGVIDRKEERERLDQFARRMRATPNSKAYVLAYGGARSWPGEAIERATCVSEYLVKVKKISKRRVAVIDGGYEEEATIALFLGNYDGNPAPFATPTLKPGDVQISKDNRPKGHPLLCREKFNAKQKP